ncbi:RNase H domain-containing protein [Trichonephila clavipes]|nr:RNase H domain-containing protein [Trichonephila clavipes]
MATGSYLTTNYSRSQSEIQGDLHNSNTVQPIIMEIGMYMYFFVWRRFLSYPLCCSSPPGLLGNEVADDLAKAATSNPVDPEDHMVLTSTKIYSRAKELICRTWVVPPVHPWYFQRHPGSVKSFKGSRSYQMEFS